MSPKKCRELECIIDELKVCLEPTEMPSKGGTHPLSACGTQFVAHKVTTLERMIDRFGAYTMQSPINHDRGFQCQVSRQREAEGVC